MAASVAGRVRLVAEWTITDAHGNVGLHRLETDLQQRSDGYPALIDAHRDLLDELARAVAATLGS